MKKQYEAPLLMVEEFQTEDVIATSGEMLLRFTPTQQVTLNGKNGNGDNNHNCWVANATFGQDMNKKICVDIRLMRERVHF